MGPQQGTAHLYPKKASLFMKKREEETLNSFTKPKSGYNQTITGRTHCLQFRFEAVSQTEFLSFDQLSQSHIFTLWGTPGAGSEPHPRSWAPLTWDPCGQPPLFLSPRYPPWDAGSHPRAETPTVLSGHTEHPSYR